MTRELFGIPLSLGVLFDALLNGFGFLDVFIEALLSVSGSLFIASSIGLDRIAPMLGIAKGGVQLIVLFFAALYVTNLVFTAVDKIQNATDNDT